MGAWNAPRRGERCPQHRLIEGLRLVVPGAPPPFPKPRLRGSRAAGLRHERRVGTILRKRLKELRSGEWFQFVDENGTGFAQPDHYAVLDDRVICFECKLSETGTAFSQILELYAPILSHVYGRPVQAVQVVRHIRQQSPILTDDLEEVLRRGPANLSVLHLLT